MTSPDSVVQTAQELPKWAMAAIVIGGGLLAWKLMSGMSSNPDEDTAQSHADKQRKAYEKGSRVTPWNQRARDVLISRGYSQTEANSALRHYLGGGTMSPADSSAIATVIQAIGTPQFPNSDPSYSASSPQTSPGPGAPNAGLLTEQDTGGVGNAINFTADPTDSVPTYWYVPSLGFGNTATYRGLAKLYYGNEELAPMILAVNRSTPLAPSTTWQAIPPGLITKVPRSVSV